MIEGQGGRGNRSSDRAVEFVNLRNFIVRGIKVPTAMSLSTHVCLFDMHLLRLSAENEEKNDREWIEQSVC